MENKDYLDRISNDSRPLKTKTKKDFLASPIVKILAGCAVATLLLIIIVAIFGGNKNDVKTQCIKLKLQLNNSLEVISKYQPEVKSSALRSSSASLYSVLSNTDNELNTYLTEKYDFKEKSVDEKIKKEATAKKEELDTSLFEAKINGILDRIYAHKMAYEISTIMTGEANILKSTSNEDLKNLLEKSYTSLEKLYVDFTNFSETK